MSKSYTTAETAKLIRQALREAFPGIKFSVRSSVYAGGSSIRVGWVDGPNSAQVEAVAKRFQGCYFDGSCDLKGYLRKMYCGEMVSFGADYVFCEPKHSARLVEAAIAALWAQRWVDLENVARPTADDFLNGRTLGQAWTPGGYDLHSRIWQKLCKRSDRFALNSPTAANVISLGNDGHSPVGALEATEA